MIDTLDLVVVGYKKNEYYTLACYDNNKDEFIVIGLLSNNQLPKTIKVYVKQDPRVISMYDVDDAFYPEFVVEVSVQAIAACISNVSPYFLISPKFIKIRKDKNANQATTLSEIESLYNMQN